MNSLPIPKLRSSWVAALILSLIIFILYYLFVFNSLLTLYRSQFDKIVFEQSKSQVGVLAFVPQYYNSSESSWAYLNVQNNSNNPIYDLEVYLVTKSNESTLLLPSLYNGSVYSSGNTFSVIEPHSIGAARIPFVTQGDAVISKVILIQKNDKTREELERQSPTEYIQPNKSAFRVLQHSFLENILLPPWSNTFILALVLFSTYLVRSGKEEELTDEEDEANEPKTFTLDWWLCWVWKDIKSSIDVLAWMLFFVILFVIVDLPTLPIVFCIIALRLMWWLDTEFWREEKLRKLRRVIVLLALFFVLSGLLKPSLILFFSSFATLFPGIMPSWLQPNDMWIWILTLLASMPLFMRNWRNIDLLEKYIKQFYFWGWSCFILSLIYLVVFYFEARETVSEFFSWYLLLIVSFVLLIWRFYKQNRTSPPIVQNKRQQLKGK